MSKALYANQLASIEHALDEALKLQASQQRVAELEAEIACLKAERAERLAVINRSEEKGQSQ